MKIWVIQDGEPIPGIDKGARPWRAAMLAKALTEQGHKVLWWASTFDHAFKRFRFGEASLVELQPSLQVYLLHGPGYQHNKSLRRLWHNRVLSRSFAREARRFSPPDVVLASLPTLELAEQAVIYGKQLRVPVVVDVRDLWPDHYLTLVPVWLRSIMRRLLFAEFQRVRRILKDTFGIISISHRFLRWGLNYAGRSVRKSDGVFPMGYPSFPFSETEILVHQEKICRQYKLSSSEFIVGFSGSINSIFDFDTVIKAAKIIERSDTNVKFALMGDGTNYSSVREQARKQKNIIFTGRVDYLSVIALLRLSSVGLAPYAEGNSIGGSLPNKAFEYMAVGLPILSSLSGELKELLITERIGFHYKSGDVRSLVDKVVWLVRHPYERKKMGERARKLFEQNFSENVIYPKLAQHLESVVKFYTTPGGQL